MNQYEMIKNDNDQSISNYTSDDYELSIMNKKKEEIIYVSLFFFIEFLIMLFITEYQKKWNIINEFYFILNKTKYYLL